MKTLTAITDPIYQPKQANNQYERFWLKRMNDKRDLPFIYLLSFIHIIVIPTAILLYTHLLNGWLWWLIAVPYFYVSQFYYKGRFGLMFHCICHRKLFKRQYKWLHTYVTWVVCPFFGHTPESYFSHHIGMHHLENNMPDDTSSTMRYQRDSLRSFFRYYINFLFLGFKNTLLYLYSRKRKKMYVPLTFGELFFYFFAVGMCFVNLKATLVVFIVPFLFARLVMMLGNWTQHAFVDRDDPENVFTNSINCINTPYNKTCWNDGYHIIHHLRPGLHYTELPLEFLKQTDVLAKNKALVFDGIHYLHIFIYLLSKRYDKLAENLVNINSVFTGPQEAIEVMQERTKKIT